LETSEKYIKRCFELAQNGMGQVAPNPLVGAVIVYNDKIIGEGYHRKYGEPHAEVNAIDSVLDKSLLKDATLYVNLEPCCHEGKTPACTDLILKSNIPRVCIAALDPNPIVAGNGLRILEESGLSVEVGILENDALGLNRRFYTFYQKKRPYVILKWAQSKDGFIGKINKKIQISNVQSQYLSHVWRSEEAAIMVGTQTAKVDNPQLDVRLIMGNNPIRIVLDRTLKLHYNLNLFDQTTPTIVFTEKSKKSIKNIEYINIDFSKDVILEMINILYEKNIQSIIVEGGTLLLNSFIRSNLWDEARVFIAENNLGSGIIAPKIKNVLFAEEQIGDDKLTVYKNE